MSKSISQDDKKVSQKICGKYINLYCPEVKTQLHLIKGLGLTLNVGYINLTYCVIIKDSKIWTSCSIMLQSNTVL